MFAVNISSQVSIQHFTMVQCKARQGPRQNEDAQGFTDSTSNTGTLMCHHDLLVVYFLQHLLLLKKKSCFLGSSSEKGIFTLQHSAIFCVLI